MTMGHIIVERLSTHDVNVATILSQFTGPELIIPRIPWLLHLKTFSQMFYFKIFFKILACWLPEHSCIDYFHQQRALSVARLDGRFPAQKLTKTRPKTAQNFNCQNNVI